jgi:hypothetical protein
MTITDFFISIYGAIKILLEQTQRLNLLHLNYLLEEKGTKLLPYFIFW